MNNSGKILLIFLLLAATLPGTAQLKGFGFGPYIEGARLTGDFRQTHKDGFGVGLAADIKLPGKLGITGSAGYMHFAGKGTGDGKAPAINAYPLRAGLKYRPVPLIYFKLEGGSAQFTKGNGSAFILSPGIGIRILGIDIQGKYEAWFRDDIRFWGIKAGLNF